MKDEKIFSRRLSDLIAKTTIRGFAKDCGVSEGSLRRYMKGESDPSLGHVKAIAEAAGVSMGWLAGLETDGGNKKPGFTIEKHRAVGLELYIIGTQLQNLINEFDYSYPRSGELSKATGYLKSALEEIRNAQSKAEENLFKDHPESHQEELHIYYPANVIGRDKLLKILSMIAKTHEDAFVEFIEEVEKKRTGKNYLVAEPEPKYINADK